MGYEEWDCILKMLIVIGWHLAPGQIESQGQIWEMLIEFRGLIIVFGRDELDWYMFWDTVQPLFYGEEVSGFPIEENILLGNSSSSK